MTNHKATIETMINTAAIALTSFGTFEITKGNYFGFVVIMFAMGLEYFKYKGRKNRLW